MNDKAFTNPENVIRDMIGEVPQTVNCARVGKIIEVVENESGTVSSVNVRLDDGDVVNCLLFCLAGTGAFLDFENFLNSDCLVIFTDKDISAYKLGNRTVAGIDTRRHTLNNGIAISGIFNFETRPKGSDHFVSYEQLDEILTEWTEGVASWMDDAANALKAAFVAQAPSGTAPITFTQPLPESVEPIDISESLIGGLTHNGND